MRAKYGTVQITSALLLLATILLLWLSAKNFYAYSRMRSTQAKVLASQLRMDLHPAEDHETPAYLTYTIHLALRTQDNRDLEWETDAGKSAYPEEALDELALWAPATTHPIQMLRGNARQIRIANLEESPEWNAAIGSLIGVAILALGTLGAFIAMAEGKRAGWRKHFGPWLIFLGFGLVPLIGCGFFTYFEAQKRLTWPSLSASRTEAAHTFNASQLPPNASITPAAQASLSGTSYGLIEYTWNGRKLHGGIGSLAGVFDKFIAAPSGQYHFRSHPTDRWEVSQTLDWNNDFYIPVFALLFFGLAFTGASLLVRKTQF